MSAPDMTPGNRLPALDWMRGVVMVLMVVDHAGNYFDGGHLASDSVLMYQGEPLPVGPFLTRFISHFCAPSFVFLAGTALALSVERRQRSQSWLAIDGHLLLRGAILIALELTVVSASWWFTIPRMLVFQVLFAIGAGMILMIVLRRLPSVLLLILALALVAGSESIASASLAARNWAPAPWLLFAARFGVLPGEPGQPIHGLVMYPVLPWLAMLLLGWVFGRRLGHESRSPRRLLIIWGSVALATFVILRGLDGYGNMLLHRTDDSLLQWLHVSKYPPSITFTALTLGVLALALAALFFVQERQQVPPSRFDPLLVFGQTPLFFYVVHLPLLGSLALVTDMIHQGGLRATYLATAAALVILYPLCYGYRSYKSRHPRSWARYV